MTEKAVAEEYAKLRTENERLKRLVEQYELVQQADKATINSISMELDRARKK